jgi:phosphoribosyl 1,2-cyclic phosphate phosphodiesterase
MRASLFIEGDGGERAIIDTGPEFRLQAIRAGITALDGIFLTHSHADHVHGLDDVRPLSHTRGIPIYGNAPTMEEMGIRFSYAFTNSQVGGGKPRVTLNPVTSSVRVGGLTLTPIPVKHGVLDILGWKIAQDRGPAAVYLTDTSFIPPASLALIQEPAVFIIGALRERPHETHFSFDQALSAAVEIRAPRTFLTHICHTHSHREIEEFCRRFRDERRLGDLTMGPAYDTLEISLPSNL